MRGLFCLGVFVVGIAGVSGAGSSTLAPKTIKEVMAEGHKGKPALCGLANTGKASKDDIKKLVALYEDLGKSDPPKGDKAAWKKKCDDLLTATKALEKDPADKAAVKAYAAAVNCKGCHTDHK
jgi:hypothetical protein